MPSSRLQPPRRGRTATESVDTQLAQRLHFSLMTFAAAMLALYVAMSIDLQQPYWSMMTVFIVSQPLAAAVRSKALQRLLAH